MSQTIEVEGLVYRYHLTEALHGISFHLHRGEIVGLLGPNGAGKSTTIRVLAGTLSPSAGRVCVDGFQIPERRMEAKRINGYVPETAGLYESLTAQEFLEFIGRIREEGNEVSIGPAPPRSAAPVQGS